MGARPALAGALEGLRRQDVAAQLQSLLAAQDGDALVGDCLFGVALMDRDVEVSARQQVTTSLLSGKVHAAALAIALYVI